MSFHLSPEEILESYAHLNNLSRDSASAHGLHAGQFSPLEMVLLSQDHTPVKSGSPFREIRRAVSGKIGSVPVVAGVIDLGVSSAGVQSSMMIVRYAHNERRALGPLGAPDVYNDAVVNVLLSTNGDIYGMVMLSSGTYSLHHWNAPSIIEGPGFRLENPHPSNADCALQSVRSQRPLLPLTNKLALLMLSASDGYMNLSRDYLEAERQMLSFDHASEKFTITRDKIPRELATILSLEDLQHPLSGLVEQHLIPEQTKVVIVDHYDELLQDIAMQGFTFPTAFIEKDAGIYVSASAPWSLEGECDGFYASLDDPDIDDGVVVIARTVSDSPDSLKGLRHNLMLRAYQHMDEGAKSSLFGLCEREVACINELLNHTYLRSVRADGPDYSFRSYSQELKHRFIAGFVSGIMTLGKDFYPYWAGEPLWGKGTSIWNWTPDGMREAMSRVGFRVDAALLGKLHPVGVRHSLNGELDNSPFEYAHQVRCD